MTSSRVFFSVRGQRGFCKKTKITSIDRSFTLVFLISPRWRFHVTMIQRCEVSLLVVVLRIWWQSILLNREGFRWARRVRTYFRVLIFKSISSMCGWGMRMMSYSANGYLLDGNPCVGYHIIGSLRRRTFVPISLHNPGNKQRLAQTPPCIC